MMLQQKGELNDKLSETLRHEAPLVTVNTAGGGAHAGPGLCPRL